MAHAWLVLDLLLFSTSAAASVVTVSSGDGSLSLSFDGAAISATSLTGGTTNSQPAFALTEFSSGAAGPAANSSENMAANGDFNVADATNPAHAEGWNSAADTCPLGYTRVTSRQFTRAGHPAAIMVTTPNATAKAGAQHVWTAPPGKLLDTDSIIVSGWSKALSDDGGGGDYALYVDLIYADGTPQWGSRADFTSGPHDWEYKYHIITLEKPVKEMTIYCLYRGRKGSVLFDSVSVGLPTIGPSATAFVGKSSVVVGQNNLSAVTVHASKTSAIPSLQYNVTATFHGHSDHIRLDGAVVAASTTADGFVPDRAVSLSFAMPLAASGWSLWSDTDTSVTIGTEREYAGQSQTLRGSPHPIDMYPFATLTSPGGKEGIAIGVPMESVVYVQRTHYTTENSSLVITFDFGLTNRYYDLHPHAFLERIIRDQGIWMPFKSNLRDIEGGWEDFGVKFQEGGGDLVSERYMNAHGVGIYPYIEPHILHWPLPKGMLATWTNINQTVFDCVAHPQKYTHCSGDGNDCRRLCKMIAENAVVDSNGQWVFQVEHAEWNEGALLYADLNPSTLGDATSRATAELESVTEAYRAAVASGVTLGGQYIDSTMGFGACGLVNLRDSSLRTSAHPPVYDVEGNVGVLFAQSLFSFLKRVSDTVHSRGQYLFGNALWDVPQLSFPSIFDISGTETGWQTDGEFAPPTPEEHRFKRAMTAAQPYLYLMDTDFNTWSYENTNQYLQICLAYGHWPGFFSADAASATYFDNASLYNRDRALFQQFIPPLRKINAAGWRPLTHARVSSASNGSRFQLERWGDGFGKGSVDARYAVETKTSNSTSISTITREQLFFTLRSLSPNTSADVVLNLDLSSLGITAGTAGDYIVKEIAQRITWKSGKLTEDGTLAIGFIAANLTLVLQVERT